MSTVSFDQSAYSIDEDVGLAQPALVLCYSLLFETTIVVLNTDGSSTGELVLPYLFKDNCDYRKRY